jgi:L-ascorbate metabolism protein UlaG (beta-lactamase superfamily)
MLLHSNRCGRFVRFLRSMRFVRKVRMPRYLPHVILPLLFGGLLPRIASAQGEVHLSYLGTAGWEITDGKIVILVDPYLSRLKRPTPNDAVLSDDPRPLFGLDSIGISDEAVIDAHIKKADFVLITHTHSDHALDLPYIARKTGAMVIGMESTINLARASGVPGNQLLSVKGGADLEFGVSSVRVIPSLHGILRRAPNMPPIPGPLPRGRCTHRRANCRTRACS